MLSELFEYLTTPCPRWARERGYLNQAIRLHTRARRCRAAWQPHVTACRQLILEAMALCSGEGAALVLGSGLLLEVPLSELAARFTEVVLVDAVHLAPVRRAMRAYPNVRLVNADLTGTAPGAPAPAALWGERAFLFGVSANLLSQLPLLVMAFGDQGASPPGPLLGPGAPDPVTFQTRSRCRFGRRVRRRRSWPPPVGRRRRSRGPGRR